MKIIITGTTGMIGEGILLECLNIAEISEILSVSRKPCNISHAKLKELIVPDFLSLNENDERLMGYDACFYCAGISSVGMGEEQYRTITYDTTLQFAKAVKPNPSMSFVFVSGGGTDSSEKGSMMWARVKGKTENDLSKLPFKQTFGFRIGFVEPAAHQQHILKLYNYIGWLTPLIKLLFPTYINTMAEVAHAMYMLSKNGYDTNVIHVKDIKQLSNEYLK